MSRSGGSYIVKDGIRTLVSHTSPPGSPPKAKDVPVLGTDKSLRGRPADKSSSKPE